jgi:hypothetical protein
MNERTNANEVPKEIEHIVSVGYSGAERMVRFQGIQLCRTSTYWHSGPNNSRWHEYTLYEVQGKDDGPAYRVLDEYVTRWENENGHSKLSAVLSAKELGKKYPEIANQAVEEGYLTPGDVSSEASDGVEE